MFKIGLALFVSALIPNVAAAGDCEISGIWNHSAKPAKLYVDLVKKEVSVFSHELNPENIGRVLIDSLVPDLTPSLWKAKMYNGDTDSMVDVRITLKSCNQLNVSYSGELVLELVR